MSGMFRAKIHKCAHGDHHAVSGTRQDDYIRFLVIQSCINTVRGVREQNHKNEQNMQYTLNEWPKHEAPSCRRQNSVSL